MSSCSYIKAVSAAVTSASANALDPLTQSVVDLATQKICEAFLKCLKVSEIPSASIRNEFFKINVLTPNEFKIDVLAPFTEHDTRIKSFLDSLQKASRSENPLPEIKLAFEPVKRMCASDIFFLPFLKDIDALFKKFDGKPQQTQQVLISLLKKVFSQEMTSFKGHTLSEELLCLIELDDRLQELDSVSLNLDFALNGKVCDYGTILLWYKNRCIYEDKFLERTLLPRVIASMLFQKEGSFNPGIIPAVMRVLQFRDAPSPDKLHMSAVLREIEDDERIGQFFEHIAPPKKGSAGGEIVNVILGRPLNQECSMQDTKLVLLASLLTPLMQSDLGNCFIVARHLEIREGRALQYLEELYELISKGFITRTLGQQKREVHLFGLKCALPRACYKTFTECPRHLFDFPVPPSVLYAGRAVRNPLLENAAIRNALRLLGCINDEELQEIWASLPVQKEHSIEELLEQIAAKNGASTEDVVNARLLFESAGQDVLGQIWQNAVASEAIMQWPILQEYLETLGRDIIKRYWPDEVDETALSELVKRLCFEHENIGFSVIPQGKEHFCSIFPYIERNGTAIRFDSVESFSQYIHELDMDLYKVITSYVSATFLPQVVDNSSEYSRKRFLHFLQHKLTNSICKNLLEKIEQAESLEINFKSSLVQIHLPPHVYALQKLIPFPSFQVPKEFCLKSWICEFLKEKERLQVIHGIDSTFSALALGPGEAHESGLAHGAGHVFRYLFFHPSIVPIKTFEDLLQKRERLLQALKKPRFTKHAAQIKLMDLHSLSGLSADGLYSIQEIIESIHKTLLEWDELPTFVDLNKEMVIKEYIFKFTSALMEKGDFANPFIHFADMNWENKGEAQHAAFWLDPITKEWEIVYVTENDKPLKVVSLEEVKNYFYFSQIADVTPKEYLEQKSTKQLHDLDLKLQKIEQTFLDAWDGLKKYLHRMNYKYKEEVAKEILYCQTHPPFSVRVCPEEKMRKLHTLAEQPTSWKQPFEVCLKLMALYQRVLKRRLELDQGPVEFHRTRAFKPTGFLSFLESKERLIMW